MDVQTALVCVGVAVVSAVVLFAISMFGMKEKTYEEAIAEQRKMPEENLLLGRTTKDKVKDKKQKKAGKKVKEKPAEREKPEAPVVTPAPPQEKVHVDFEEPEAEVVSERPPQEEKKKKKIKEKVKPILLNKDEPVLIVEEPPTPANHFEEILPKDDLLLKRKGSKEEINIKPPVVETETSLDAPVIEAPKQAAAKQVVIKMDQAAPRNKKKKSEMATLQQMSGEAVNMNVLMLMVRKAELSRSEIQILIDQLLNKQQGTTVGNAEWIEGRQDPMVKLKKQLAEKEKALTEEQEAAQAVQSKLKELRGELNAERSRSRQLEESLVAKQNELTAIATRLQHQVDSHQALTQQNQQLQAKLNEERLILQQELHKQAEIRIAHITEQQQEAEAALNAQIGQLHAQLQEREGMNAALNAELQKLNEIMGENKMLMDQIAHLEGQIRHLENQTEELARQNEELHHLKSELEHHVSNARQVEASLQYEAKNMREELEEKCAALADLEAEVSQLHADNEQLSSQITLVKDLQAEVQRLRDENDRLTSQVTALSQLELEAQQLREENESLAAQVTAVTERPAAEGRENGDVHFADEKEFMEFTPSKEKALIENEKLIEQLAEELKEKTSLVEKLNSEIDTYKTEINVLNERCATQCKKNEELRTKNWKVLDALSVTEKELESKVLESKRIVSEARAEGQAATQKLLERIFPDIKVDNTKSHEAWLEKFEHAVKSFVSQLKSAQSSSSLSEDRSAMLIELEKQNSQLQAMVTHYKAIIEDTEGMLNKLQSHVEQEEAKWRQQLQVKETELESIREERDRLEQTLDHLHSSEEMQTKLEELQDKLNVEEQEKKKLIQHYEDQLNQEKSRLATELEKSQDMYKEIVKLRSLVQIGQDSLSQEQQMVQQLQQQLNGVTQNSLNGPAQESTVAESLSTSPQPLSETTEKRPKSKKKKGGSGRK